MSEADVIPIGSRAPRDDAPIRRRPSRSYCRHQHVELDHGIRRVYCADCKAEVDAFATLEMLAAGFERYEIAVSTAKREVEQYTTYLADLKRQVRNAKAQIRRAGK